MTQFTNFYYDPQRQGYDTSLWKTLSGSPSISSNQIRLNSAAIVHYGDIRRGDVTLGLTIPTDPATGDDKEWGLVQLNRGAFAKFDITDDVFTCQVYDGKSAAATTATVTWATAWAAAVVNYRIKWEGGRVEFWVNSNKVAVIADANVTGEPMSIYASNGDADDVDLAFVEAISIQSYS